VSRREPGPHLDPADLDRVRVGEAAVADLPLPHGSSKLASKHFATPSEATLTMTLSCLVQESTIQLAEPLQTASASRIAYLWRIGP